jgi:ribonuclease D
MEDYVLSQGSRREKILRHFGAENEISEKNTAKHKSPPQKTGNEKIPAKPTVNNADSTPAQHRTTPDAPGGETETSDIYAQLRALRTRFSRLECRPVKQVLSDDVLYKICEVLPKDEAELLGIKGMGLIKLEKYGGKILETIADCLKKPPINPNPEKISVVGRENTAESIAESAAPDGGVVLQKENDVANITQSTTPDGGKVVLQKENDVANITQSATPDGGGVVLQKENDVVNITQSATPEGGGVVLQKENDVVNITQSAVPGGGKVVLQKENDVANITQSATPDGGKVVLQKENDVANITQSATSGGNNVLQKENAATARLTAFTPQHIIEIDPALFRKLKGVREQIAETEKVFPFKILRDFALRDMCVRAETLTKAAILNSYDTGSPRFSKHIERFYGIIQRHLNDGNFIPPKDTGKDLLTVVYERAGRLKPISKSMTFAQFCDNIMEQLSIHGPTRPLYMETERLLTENGICCYNKKFMLDMTHEIPGFERCSGINRQGQDYVHIKLAEKGQEEIIHLMRGGNTG